MIALALETVTPFNSLFVSCISLQNRFYAVFFVGTSSLSIFKDFTLKVLHTLSAFCIKKSFSSSTPLVNSQGVLSKAVVCMLVSGILCISRHLTCISKDGHKFFNNPQGHENLFLLIIKDGRHPHGIQRFSFQVY